MNQRVAKLRQQSLDTVPRITTERAELITDFYRSAGAHSVPVLRAMAFQHLMEQKAIYIGPGELIVGERGPEPKASPTYPELCCHSLQDLDILDSREKISFAVDHEAKRVYHEQIIPFWQGRSMRDIIFRQMDDRWQAAYQAGIFTEFMEQRAPGHTVLGDKIYHRGMLDFVAEIDAALAGLNYLDDPIAYDKREELRAMRICARAIITFAERHADLAREMAQAEPDPERKGELERILAVCLRVPAHAPSTFWEALQYYWFVHLGVITELNTWDAFNPGRLDQHLYPFYRRGIEVGSLTREQ
ncbi:MAG: pyruvate formate lyase family protein, partial [Desulfotomaculaceae bacterium]